MNELLKIFIIVPLFGLIISLFIKRKKENIISFTTTLTFGIQFIFTIAFSVFWLLNGHTIIDIKEIVVYKTEGFEFFINFYFDKITLIFSIIGSLLCFLVARFSKYYMHREEGFKRFFISILLFSLGYNLVIFSGNFETMFIGWEILGLTSFLLISFFRDRYLPAKNALKVVSYYRLSDVCLMLAMWLSHHLWHQNITFLQFNNFDLMLAEHANQYSLAFGISILIIIAVMIKSAQFPFTAWLPRALEGPTTSSAIFYGALSVHIGVFLLLRTAGFWENFIIIKFLLIVVGLITSLVSSSIAKVQSSVKTQIAYSSAAQIGLIFIEIAMGWHYLALFHFSCNALLRTYQLLVSPSVLSYLSHEQFYHFNPEKSKQTNISGKLKNAIYVLGVKEWNQDNIFKYILWSPFKSIGNTLNCFFKNRGLLVFSILILLGIIGIGFQSAFNTITIQCLIYFFAIVSAISVLMAFANRTNAISAWIHVFITHLYLLLSILFASKFAMSDLLTYLSGIVISALIGYFILTKTKLEGKDISLSKFHGYIHHHNNKGIIFLISCLGILCFPITGAFIGIDIMFTHIHSNQPILIAIFAIIFVLIELSVLRIYLRLFTGQNKNSQNITSFRST